MPSRAAADLVSRIRELRLPRAERKAARARRSAERLERASTPAARAGRTQAESHSRHSGGPNGHWRPD